MLLSGHLLVYMITFPLYFNVFLFTRETQLRVFWNYGSKCLCSVCMCVCCPLPLPPQEYTSTLAVRSIKYQVRHFSYASPVHSCIFSPTLVGGSHVSHYFFMYVFIY